MEWVLNNIREWLISFIRYVIAIVATLQNVLTFLEMNVKVFRSEITWHFVFILNYSSTKEQMVGLDGRGGENEWNIAEYCAISIGVHRIIGSTFCIFRNFYNTFLKEKLISQVLWYFFFLILTRNGNIGEFIMYLRTCVRNGSIINITHTSEFIHNYIRNMWQFRTFIMWKERNAHYFFLDAYVDYSIMQILYKPRANDGRIYFL